MIISFKLIAAAVVLGICAGSMSGIMAQQSTPQVFCKFRRSDSARSTQPDCGNITHWYVDLS